MITMNPTLEQTHGRLEVDIAENYLDECDELSFAADSLKEALTKLKSDGYKCNPYNGFIAKGNLSVMIWKDGFTLSEVQIAKKWASLK